MTKRQAMGASARMKRRLRRLEARVAELEAKSGRRPLVVIVEDENGNRTTLGPSSGASLTGTPTPVEVVR